MIKIDWKLPVYFDNSYKETQAEMYINVVNSIPYYFENEAILNISNLTNTPLELLIAVIVHDDINCAYNENLKLYQNWKIEQLKKIVDNEKANKRLSREEYDLLKKLKISNSPHFYTMCLSLRLGQIIDDFLINNYEPELYKIIYGLSTNNLIGIKDMDKYEIYKFSDVKTKYALLKILGYDGVLHTIIKYKESIKQNKKI